MIKRLSALFLCFLLCGDASANIQMMQQMVIARKNASGVDNTNITFYHDADALDDANCSTGSGTVTYDAGILLGTASPAVGTGYWDNNNDGFDDLRFAVSSNVDFSGGRIGFWFKPNETASGRICYTNGSDFYFEFLSPDDLRLHMLGSSFDYTSANLSAGTWYYIEIEFNTTTATLLIDGSSKGSASGSGSVDDTTFHFGSVDGNAWDAHYDNVVISTNPDEDLYSRRNDTNFCS